MDEVVLASAYDELWEAYQALLKHYEAELHRSFHRLPPREKPKQILDRVKVEHREPL